MSLIATLIPAALVVASVIDDVYYNKWIIAGKYVINTRYSERRTIISDLKRLKVNYSIQHNAIRVYGNSKDEYYYFSQNNGVWEFSFSKYDDLNSIRTFVNKLASISESILISDFNNAVSNEKKGYSQTMGKMPPLPQSNSVEIPTRFSDFVLLEKALVSLDCSVIKNTNGFRVERNGLNYAFYLKDGQIYLRIDEKISEEDLFRELQDLDIVYSRNVQKKSYDYIMQQIKEKGLSVSNQTVSEDDTIVLTINME